MRGAYAHARKLKLECAQLFDGNPRSFRVSAWRREDVEEFRERTRQSDLRPVVVHSRYLCNLASPEREHRKLTAESVVRNLEVAEALGGKYVVVHCGSHKGEGVRKGLARAKGTIERVLRRYAGPVQLLLENGAGSGAQIGAGLAELGALAEGFPSERVGFCLDTCHLFAAGYDFRTKEGLKRLKEEVGEYLKARRVKVLHINDSYYPAGSRRDRHEHLEEGKIAEAGFAAFFSLGWTARRPCILETPKEPPEAEGRNVRLLRKYLRQARQ